jgi:N-acetyl-alpha-D-muramate 1-phosphate uridylyltransferase
MLPIAVLAGGLATRLRPITENIPKSLIVVNNTPFVLHQLKLFKQNGINRVHFCLGHLGEIVKEVIEASIFSKTLEITYSFDGEMLLGTAGAIKKAFPSLPDVFFITYGDSYLDINYKSVESQFEKSDRDDYGLLTVYKNANNYDKSNVIYKKNKILLYSKKQSKTNMKYIDYGLGILKKNHFNNCPDNTPFDLSEIYEHLSKKGELLGYEILERFYEIGSVKGIKALSNYLNNKSS